MAERYKIKIKLKGFEDVVWTRFGKWGVYLGAKDGKIYQMPMLQGSRKPYVSELSELTNACDHLLTEIYDAGGFGAFARRNFKEFGCEAVGCERRKGYEGVTQKEEFSE